MTMINHNDSWLSSVLIDDEKVLCNGLIHVGIYWRGLAVLFAGIVMFVLFTPIGVILMITAAIMLSAAAFLRKYLRVVLTNKRIIARYGVVITQTVTLALDKLESIELERMLPAIIMGYSSVVITGVGSRVYRIPYVANANELRKAYDKIRL